MLTNRDNSSEKREQLIKLEVLLFVSPAPVSINQLASVLGIDVETTQSLIAALAAEFNAHHGFRVQKINDQYQLTTAPEHAEMVEMFLGLEVTQHLTQASLEALAIIAYKQPTTRPEVDSIRGVNSDGVIKSLLSKGLIEELGRSESLGRPILYGITPQFLQHFGLNGIDELPAINFEALINNQTEPEESKRILKD